MVGMFMSCILFHTDTYYIMYLYPAIDALKKSVASVLAAHEAAQKIAIRRDRDPGIRSPRQRPRRNSGPRKMRES